MPMGYKCKVDGAGEGNARELGYTSNPFLKNHHLLSNLCSHYLSISQPNESLSPRTWPSPPHTPHQDS